jgi:antitoxin CcdA
METTAMPSSTKPRKKAVNLTIDAGLAAEARAFGTNLSATLEKALHQEHRDKRSAKWRKDNRVAVEAWNKLVDEDGLWIEKYRS